MSAVFNEDIRRIFRRILRVNFLLILPKTIGSPLVFLLSLFFFSFFFFKRDHLAEILETGTDFSSAKVDKSTTINLLAFVYLYASTIAFEDKAFFPNVLLTIGRWQYSILSRHQFRIQHSLHFCITNFSHLYDTFL